MHERVMKLVGQAPVWLIAKQLMFSPLRLQPTLTCLSILPSRWTFRYQLFAEAV